MVDFFQSSGLNGESIIVVALSLVALFGINYWINRISNKSIFDKFEFSN